MAKGREAFYGLGERVTAILFYCYMVILLYGYIVATLDADNIAIKPYIPYKKIGHFIGKCPAKL